MSILDRARARLQKKLLSTKKRSRKAAGKRRDVIPVRHHSEAASRTSLSWSQSVPSNAAKADADEGLRTARSPPGAGGRSKINPDEAASCRPPAR
jgi:hypothetical protein